MKLTLAQALAECDCLVAQAEVDGVGCRRSQDLSFIHGDDPSEDEVYRGQAQSKLNLTRPAFA